MEAAVRPERLLKDLRNLWVDLGKDEPAGVLRACAMTLDRRGRGGAGRAGDRARRSPHLMHEHPSRAIVLRVRSGAEPCTVGSRVRAMLDAVREPSADLLRAGGDHQQSGQFLGCDVSAPRTHRSGPSCRVVLPE